MPQKPPRFTPNFSIVVHHHQRLLDGLQTVQWVAKSIALNSLVILYY
jgi:hypothetical protein